MVIARDEIENNLKTQKLNFKESISKDYINKKIIKTIWVECKRESM